VTFVEPSARPLRSAELAAGLTVHAYDDPASLWCDMRAAWTDEPASALVFVSETAKERFVRRHSQTLWDDRVLSVGDLWSAVGQVTQVADISPARQAEMRTALRRVLTDASVSLPEELRRLTETASGLDALAKHLADIETRADRAYVPRTDIERGVSTVRQQLKDARIATRAGYWSEVSRHAKHAALGRPIIFAPAGQVSPHVAGLMKGLAVHQAVSAYVLTSRSQLPRLLEIAQLNAEGAVIAEHFSDRTLAAQLFTGAPSRPYSQTVRWAQVADENEAAIDAACALIGEGYEPQDIALVLPSPVSDATRLARLAAKARLPIRLTRRFYITDSPIGAVLLALARLDRDSHSEIADLLDGDGRRVGLTEDDVELWRQAGGRVLDQLTVIAQIGWDLLSRSANAGAGDQDIVAVQAFLTGLEQDINAYTLSRLHPADVIEALMDASSKLLAVGSADGVAVVRYDEASGCEVRAAVVCGLHADGWPGTQERSPFVSQQLVEACPALDAIDPRPEFVGAVATASDHVLFVRRDADSDEPGPLWQETRQLNPQANMNPPAPRSRQRLLQRLARAGLLPVELQELNERASRERLPQGALGGTRTTYSVTELEQYLSCPYGWFVRYVIEPARQPSAAAQLGSLQHAILDASLAADVSGREQIIRDQVQFAAETGQLTHAQATTMLPRLLKVSEIYSGQRWPFRRHHREVSLAAQLLDGYTIVGRADRVDINQSGALVIDYKNRRAPRRKGRHERLSELQRYLYPQLAARRFGVAPLGAIYVSLFHGAHDGSLVDDISGVSNDATDSDWHTDLQDALEAVRGAIDAIESGEWSTVGTSCGEWCAHHLISRTVENS
jgi:hypothetical protein